MLTAFYTICGGNCDVPLYRSTLYRLGTDEQTRRNPRLINIPLKIHTPKKCWGKNKKKKNVGREGYISYTYLPVLFMTKPEWKMQYRRGRNRLHSFRADAHKMDAYSYLCIGTINKVYKKCMVLRVYLYIHTYGETRGVNKMGARGGGRGGGLVCRISRVWGSRVRLVLSHPWCRYPPRPRPLGRRSGDLSTSPRAPRTRRRSSPRSPLTRPPRP